MQKAVGHSILLIILLVALEFAYGSECQLNLNDPDATFMVVEVSEDQDVGALLASYSTINVHSIKASSSNISDYIGMREFQKSNQKINFFLKKSLMDYRDEIWEPYIEFEFNISCTFEEEPLIPYVFMVIIRDENIYEPRRIDLSGFVVDGEETLEYNITIPWPKDRPINTSPIRIQDKDYNSKYSTCNFTCLGDDCKYFEVIGEKLNEEVRGKNYDVNIYIKDNLTEVEFTTLTKRPVDSVFSLTVVASDSNYTTNTLVTFRVSQAPVMSDESEFPTLAVAGGGSLIAVLGLVFAAGWSYTTVKNRKARNILRKLTEAEIREFLEGSASFGAATPKRSIDVNTPIMAMPYNHAFEISRNNLRIDETTILGTGFFGIVMKGTVIRPNEENLTVAVKAVKRNVGVLYFKALLSELKIMAFIGRHNNIVSLIGACTHNIRKREVYIAVEYCSNGNLHNFLQVNRTNFLNMVKDGKLCGLNTTNNYAYRRKSSASKTISTLNLIKWSMQISHGMEYLSSLGVIHGDIATRNILLDSVRVAKIADFGLSRRLIDYSSDYYTKTTQSPVPWKWMAPESLRDMKFSKKSDVWSYGIVLYEIFTLGQTPYPGFSWDETFVEKLLDNKERKGYRMQQPQFASNDIYEIMCDCWTEDPHDRPAIDDIKRTLEGMASSLLLQTSDEGYFRVVGGPEKYINIALEETDEYAEETYNAFDTNV